MPIESMAFTETNSRSVNQIGFSPDGQRLACAMADPEGISFWKVPNWNKSDEIIKANGSLLSVAYSPDGRTLATGGNDSSIALWDIDEKRIAKEIGRHDYPIRWIGFDPTGNVLASAELSWELTIRLWDVESGELIRNLGKAAEVIFDAGGQSYLWDSPEGIQVRDIATGETIRVLSDEDGASLVALSNDGKTLVSETENGTLKLWNIGLDEAPTILSPPHQEFAMSRFSPDGKHLICVSQAESSIKIWDTERRKEVQVIYTRTDQINSVALSPNGKYLVCSGSGIPGGTLEVWDTGW